MAGFSSFQVFPLSSHVYSIWTSATHSCRRSKLLCISQLVCSTHYLNVSTFTSLQDSQQATLPSFQPPLNLPERKSSHPSSTHSPALRSSVRPFIYPYIHLSTSQSIHPSIQPSIHLSTHSFIALYIRPSVHLSVRPYPHL